ncbi:YjeF N-terminal domain-like protein [Aspergillus sclerotiicarbonarius CBS 121057]|uniref:NAD(P)H-hydrate epimerase n=1 Tax=Aspergillus sclerotiicarbonarius (strain CBS 121057 / IBT 28362) TaxID=1448318 RepID=A0A319E5B4_ASPSB|nr:YjeF N-terminal domain-like protein [Aspergillus sclerotiicarbonarius CBS 121057]
MLYPALARRNRFPALFRYYSRSAKMSLKAISSKDAASLDQDLMEIGGWSLDQLMELAGLSVSQAVYRIHPPSSGKDVLVVCGPGNNGGDGLVAARHLAQYGYRPSIFYPKQGKNELYQRLKTQLENLSVPFVSDLAVAIKSSDFLVDAIFGFSFGGPLREPFPTIISQIETATIPVLSVDAPSSWDIESGPPKEGPGSKFMPEALISLTAPKPCVKYYRGRHFLGGRFLTKSITEKYGLDLPQYPGIDQIVEVGVDAEGRL